MKAQAATSRQMLDMIPVIRLSLRACNGKLVAGNTHLHASEPRAQLMLAAVVQDPACLSLMALQLSLLMMQSPELPAALWHTACRLQSPDACSCSSCWLTTSS